MGKEADFIIKEKDTIGKLYTDITYAISDISPFLDEKQLIKRKYYSKLSIIKDYIELLNKEELDSKQGGFLSIFKPKNTIDNLNNYKNKNKEYFTQFEHCSKCACLNCINDCKFKGCTGCRPNSHIKKCDKDKINIRTHENFIIDLTNNATGKDSRYKVLATLEDREINKQYIILENLFDYEDKFILYYYPGISSDDFGEITNPDEFDFIVETFESSDY
ncbi:hypothetical protein JCM1393_17480 [Clostridium carnis]